MKNIQKMLGRFALPVLMFFSNLCSQQTAYAQHDAVWTFGTHGGLKFGVTGLQSFTSSMTARGNSASISDASGNLMFYTDGNYVWDKNNNLMPGGINLTNGPTPMFEVLDPGNGWMADATAISMMPGSETKYYIFSERRDPIDPNWLSSPCDPAKLYYSIVDMSLNNGLGEVTIKGVLVDTNVQKLTMVAGNNCNIWLVTHEAEGSAYKSYEITSLGVNPQAVVSITGSSLTNWGNVDVAGMLTVSPDRTKLVLTNMASSSASLELSDFDPATGIVSGAASLPYPNSVVLPPGYFFSSILWQAAAFSPDNTKLYITTFEGLLIQYDLAVTPASGQVIGQITNSNNTVTGMVRNCFIYQSSMKLGPDGKIYFHYEETQGNGTQFYITMPNNDALGVIDQPNVAGAGCGVSIQPVLYIPTAPFTHYPIHFPNELGIVRVTDTITESKNICLRDSAVLIATDTSGSVYAWQDASGGYSRTVHQPGLYTLRYQTFNPCVFHIDTFKVGTPGFEFTLGNDTTICGKPPYELETMVPSGTYLWPDMSRSNSYLADSTGTYWVAVTKNGCTITDSIQLTFIDIAQDLGPDILLCVDDPIHINLEATLPGGATANWSSGTTGPTYSVTDTGTYWVEVKLAPCVASDSFHIAYDPFCYCHFAMPTAFSPNNDGMNDLFMPALAPACPVSSYMLSIYNRWGERVFSGTKPEIGWDGTYQGAQADVGTYMYRIDFLGGTRKKKYTQKGDIALVR